MVSKSKVMKVEITNVLDVKNPLSQVIIALVIANSFFDLTMETGPAVFESVSFKIVYMLFALYVLNCYKNGGCDALAMVSGVMIIILETLLLCSKVMSKI